MCFILFHTCHRVICKGKNNFSSYGDKKSGLIRRGKMYLIGISSTYLYPGHGSMGPRRRDRGKKKKTTQVLSKPRTGVIRLDIGPLGFQPLVNFYERGIILEYPPKHSYILKRLKTFTYDSMKYHLRESFGIVFCTCNVERVTCLD